jgi:hypothetical protein
MECTYPVATPTNTNTFGAHTQREDFRHDNPRDGAYFRQFFWSDDRSELHLPHAYAKLIMKIHTNTTAAQPAPL